MKYILRVDDVGQNLDQTKPDPGLRYFLQWWDEGCWSGLPVYLGVVPACIGPEEMEVLAGLEGEGALIALHGWNHDSLKNHPEHISLGLKKLGAVNVLIPPYAAYDNSTFLEAARCGITTLMGGLPGDHHDLGRKPVDVGGVLHLSGERQLWGKCYQNARTVETWEQFLPERPPDLIDSDMPVMITCHHRWDNNPEHPEFLSGVKRLRDAVADKLTTVDEARKWLEAQR